MCWNEIVGGNILYEYMKGTITYISPYYIVLEVQNIGYQISVANPFRYSSSLNQEKQLYIYQVVREDSHTLYGFEDLHQKEIFIKLMSVSGIGPKSALAIMASEDHEGLLQAIVSENVTYLTKFPGVGKKTAQQMILDLKDKVDELFTPEQAIAKMQQVETTNDQVLDEALAALQALGYSDREIKRITKDLKQTNATTTDEYLRQALKLLMKK